MLAEGEWWLIPFMDFVDEFRQDKDLSIVQEPFDLDHDRFDGLLASTIESLCDELGLEPPAWVGGVQGLEEPWFVSETKHTKLLEIIKEECPVILRNRNILVSANFLDRV